MTAPTNSDVSFFLGGEEVTSVQHAPPPLAAETGSSAESSSTSVQPRRNSTLVDIIGSVTEICITPFTFVSGNVSRNRFNPFRQRSGLLNVLNKTTIHKRIVKKSGEYNTFSDSYGKHSHLLKDFFVSILDLNWFWIIIMSILAFFLSWLFFAVVWYLVAWQHGDFEEKNIKNETFVPCVVNLKNFESCFQFSLETQQTIGYGIKAATDQCQITSIITGLQSIVGCVIQAFMTGIIFAKFAIPRTRGETILFSRNALITLRDGSLNLIIQITDMRKYSLISARVRMICVHAKETLEGEKISYYRTELPCSTEINECNGDLFMLWPSIVGHKIDEKSPFYKMGPADILRSRFEIIVLVEGTTQETSNTIQARSSYRPNEILWGRRFTNDPIMYQKKDRLYEVHHNLINKTRLDQTPRMSAHDLKR